MDSFERLRTCFIETFDLDADVDIEALQYQGIEAWDSVGHMKLVAALESGFDIMIDTQDVLDMNSFSKAKEILRKHDVNI
jgi:acyl carrier protein